MKKWPEFNTSVAFLMKFVVGNIKVIIIPFLENKTCCKRQIMHTQVRIVFACEVVP